MPGLLDYTDPSTSTADPANTGRGLLDAPNDGITYRAAMLPYGEDAQGRPHWALPGLLDAPIKAAKRLFLQGGFWKGPQDPQAASDMRNVLMTIYGGNVFARGGALPLGGLGRVPASLEGGPGDWATELISKIGKVGEEAGAAPYRGRL